MQYSREMIKKIGSDNMIVLFLKEMVCRAFVTE